MHKAEIDCLQQPLSNTARVIYTLGLRPGCDETTGLSQPLNYKFLLELVSTGGETISKGRDINRYLESLLNLGLVATSLDINQSLSGKQILLPFARKNNANMTDWHSSKYPMHLDWQPTDAVFQEISQLVGLIEKEYDQFVQGEFVAYWMGRPESQFTQYQWTQKFVLHLRHARTLYEADRKTSTGYQITNKQAEVTLNEKAKQLIEKYSGKSEK